MADGHPVTTLGPDRAAIILRGASRPVTGSVFWPPSSLPPARPAPLAVVVSPASGVAVGPASLARTLAIDAGMVVVSFDGRDAVKLDDTWEAVQWIADHAGEIDGDGGRLVLLGQAEAATAVAAMTAFARDAGWPALATQILVLPRLRGDEHARSVNTPFPDDVAGLAPCTVIDIGAAAGTQRPVDTHADAVLAYVERLRAGGVPVRIRSVRPATWKLDPARAVVDALISVPSTDRSS